MADMKKKKTCHPVPANRTESSIIGEEIYGEGDLT